MAINIDSMGGYLAKQAILGGFTQVQVQNATNAQLKSFLGITDAEAVRLQSYADNVAAIKASAIAKMKFYEEIKNTDLALTQIRDLILKSFPNTVITKISAGVYQVNINGE